MNKHDFRKIVDKKIEGLGLSCGRPKELYFGNKLMFCYPLTNNQGKTLGNIEYIPKQRIIFNCYRENSSIIMNDGNSKLIRELEKTLEHTRPTYKQPRQLQQKQ